MATIAILLTVLVTASVTRPIKEIGTVMQKITNGDLTQKVNGKYNGEFLQSKNDVNKTVSYLSSYIDEITQTLRQLASSYLPRLLPTCRTKRIKTPNIPLVAQANSATAQESAAASEEMSSQAVVLDEVVSKFKLRGTDYNLPGHAAQTDVTRLSLPE